MGTVHFVINTDGTQIDAQRHEPWWHASTSMMGLPGEIKALSNYRQIMGIAVEREYPHTLPVICLKFGTASHDLLIDSKKPMHDRFFERLSKQNRAPSRLEMS